MRSRRTSRCPSRCGSARTAAAIATLEASRTSVLTPVTPTGSRGCSGGGHWTAVTRRTRIAETSPPKNITSPQIRNSIASRTLSSSGRRGPGSRSGPSPPPVGGGGGGTCPLARRGRSTVRVVTSGSRRRAPRRWSGGPSGFAGSARRCSSLVEGQKGQQDGQVEQRRIEDAARRDDRRRQRLARPERNEGRAEDEGAHEVDRSGETDQGRQQTHGQQRQTAGDDLPLGGGAIGVDHRQEPDAGAGVVVAVETRDRQGVRQLPQEEDPEQHPGAEPEPLARRYPPRHGRQGAGHRADDRA